MVTDDKIKGEYKILSLAYFSEILLTFYQFFPDLLCYCELKPDLIVTVN